MKSKEPQLPKPAEIVTLPSVMDCHDHAYSQVVIGLNGRSEFDVDGRGNYIGPGQGCVVTSGLDHAFGGVSERSDILVLNLYSQIGGTSSVLDRINELSRSDIYFQLDGQIRQLIHMLVMEMQAHPDDEVLSRACNDTVIALLCRHTSGFKSLTKDIRLDMDVIDQYIESHLSSKISVTQMAGSVFLGESQFHLLFKQQTGITPHQYVLNKRVDLAKAMMEQGAMNLSHVAELCGFSSQSAFTHTFSRLAGCSPSKYKKQFS